jgi:hypothetical protein
VTVDASKRRFLLSSGAHPAYSVEPRELRLVVYTAARSAEVLLEVRCYGQT